MVSWSFEWDSLQINASTNKRPTSDQPDAARNPPLPPHTHGLDVRIARARDTCDTQKRAEVCYFWLHQLARSSRAQPGCGHHHNEHTVVSSLDQTETRPHIRHVCRITAKTRRSFSNFRGEMDGDGRTLETSFLRRNLGET
jgi:hypothetical protein